MSEYQAPITSNAIPMPAPVAPIIDQLPIQDAPIPALPQVPQVPASAEAHAQAHLGITQDLTLDADLQARLGLNGASASAASQLKYGTDENGAMLYGNASTQNGMMGGARLALTDEELRLRMQASTADGGNASGSLEGGDRNTGAKFEAGVRDMTGNPDVYAKGTVRTGPVVVDGEMRDLAGNPQGTLAPRVDTEIVPGVRAGAGGIIQSGPGGTSAGGAGAVEIDTGSTVIDIHGNAQSNGQYGVGVNIHGEF